MNKQEFSLMLYPAVNGMRMLLRLYIHMTTLPTWVKSTELKFKPTLKVKIIPTSFLIGIGIVYIWIGNSE